jgi:transposase
LPASTTAGKTPRELLTKLRSAPVGRAGEAEIHTRRQLVLALVGLLEPLVAQIKQLERQIAKALAEHPDGQLFRALFRDPKSVITAAELVAEIGDCRARYPTGDALAGDAGQAAVAIESGKRKVACYRWACNKRLRDAVCTLADSTRHWHPWAADHYARQIARGHDHPRAIRGLGRAWCRVIWRCWQDRTPYDPARHRALQQHCTVNVPTPSGPRPDTAATQRMLGTAVTHRAGRRPERNALDGKPTSAIARGG